MPPDNSIYEILTTVKNQKIHKSSAPDEKGYPIISHLLNLLI